MTEKTEVPLTESQRIQQEAFEAFPDEPDTGLVYNNSARRAGYIVGVTAEKKRRDEITAELFQWYMGRVVELEQQLKDSQFCQCEPAEKHGTTTAWHCNKCGKVDKSETWLKD